MFGASLHLNRYLLFGTICINICIENFLISYKLYICVPSDIPLPKQYHNFENHLSISLLILTFFCDVSFNYVLFNVLLMLKFMKLCLYLFFSDIFLVP